MAGVVRGANDMNLDFPKLGGSMLAAGPLLMQFVNDKVAYWIGFGFLIAGPLLLSVRRKKP